MPLVPRLARRPGTYAGTGIAASGEESSMIKRLLMIFGPELRLRITDLETQISLLAKHTEKQAEQLAKLSSALLVQQNAMDLANQVMSALTTEVNDLRNTKQPEPEPAPRVRKASGWREFKTVAENPARGKK